MARPATNPNGSRCTAATILRIYCCGQVAATILMLLAWICGRSLALIPLMPEPLRWPEVPDVEPEPEPDPVAEPEPEPVEPLPVVPVAVVPEPVEPVVPLMLEPEVLADRRPVTWTWWPM